MPQRNLRVYARLVELSEPFVLPNDWSWLPVDDQCRRLADPAAVFQQLAGEFSAEQLRAAGVAEAAGDPLAIHSRLVGAEAGLIVLREADGTLLDIIVPAGSLSGVPPVLRACHDDRTRRAIEATDEKLLYAVATPAELVVLRSLGLPATSMAGMATMGLPQLRQLLALVGGRAPADLSPTAGALPDNQTTVHLGTSPAGPPPEPQGVQVVLVAGSLTATTTGIPGELRPVARYLAAAQRYLGYEWCGLHAWHVTASERGALRFLRSVHATDELREFLRTNEACHRVEDFQNGEAPPPPPIPTVTDDYLRLLKSLSGPGNGTHQQRQADRQAYEALVDERFVRPFVTRALEFYEMADQLIDMQLASVCRLYHRALPALYAAACPEGQNLWDPGAAILPSAALSQFVDLNNQLLRLIRQRESPQPRSRNREGA